MVPHPHDSGIPANQSSARLHLPIEGYTAWPQIMRLVAIASFVLVMLLACTLLLLVPEQNIHVKLDSLLLALSAFLIFEMVIVRCLIIPMNGDYGRFRINESHVDFYPLTTMGLSVQARTQSIPVVDFDGIAVQALEAQHGAPTRYGIVLMHPKRANLIRIRYTTSRSEAENYARSLAEALSLPVIPALPV